MDDKTPASGRSAPLSLIVSRLAAPLAVFRPLPGEALGRPARRALPVGERDLAVGAGAHLVEGRLCDARRGSPLTRSLRDSASPASGRGELARLALDLAL